MKNKDFSSKTISNEDAKNYLSNALKRTTNSVINRTPAPSQQPIYENGMIIVPVANLYRP
jgi:hypothetical protein